MTPARQTGWAPGIAWIAIGFLFAVGATYQLSIPATADVSWLFVVDEKLLAGARLYVDVIETNPPMSAFFYMPAVLLEHLTGFSAEVIQIWITLGLIAGSLALTVSILSAMGRDRFGGLAAAGTFVFVCMPLATFSQREHLAVALILPMLAIYMVRAEGRDIGRMLSIVAGLGAGLAIAVKPHFVAALILPAIYVIARRRSPRPLFGLEHWIAALVALAYAAVVFIWFRVYLTDILPMLSETYLASKRSLIDLLGDPMVSLTVVASIAIAAVSCSRSGALSRVLLMAAAGFLIAYLLQGKGWPYHLYPALALIALVFLMDALPRVGDVLRPAASRQANWLMGFALSATALVCLVGVLPFMLQQNRASLSLAAAIQRLAPHPKMLAISYDIAVGHPLTRMVGGNWVGTVCSQWLSLAATRLELASGVDAERRSSLDGWIARDRDILAHDLREGRPDVVIIDRQTFDIDDLMASGTEAATLMRDFVRVDGTGSVDLMMRRDRATATVAKRALAD